MIHLKEIFRFVKNKPGTIEASEDLAHSSIVKIRDELKKLIRDEEVVAKHAQQKRSNALKARHAVINAEILASKYGNLLPGNFINKLLQKNLGIQKNRAEKAENLSREADEVLNKIRDSKKVLIISLAHSSGAEPPAEVSEKDVEKQAAKEKRQLQSLSKDLEDAEIVLKEATLESEKKGQKLQNLKEYNEGKVRTEITDEGRERLKKAEAEYQNAVEKEKSIENEVQKKKALVERSEKELFQSLSKELEEAKTALKQATLEREKKEREIQNLKESIEIKAKPEFTEKEGDLKKAKEEKSHRESVQKKKFLAEHAALKYKAAVENLILRKEAELLKPLLLEPKAQGLEKTLLFAKTVAEVMRSTFVEEEIKEIPAYDISKHGDLVSFVPPKDFDVVEQTWISKPFTFIVILYNKSTDKNLYYVSEPVLDSFEAALLQRVNDGLKVILLELEVDFSRMNKELVLYNNFMKILNIYGVDLNPKSLQKIWYHIKRDYVGFGKLDVLMKDPMIEDISVVGSNTPVYLYHRKYMNIETNIGFEEEELNQTIMKLAQISGKSISVGYPIMNARLPDGSRLEATLGREVTTHGGTISIRKFREEPFTPTDLIKYGTFNTEIMAYLWLAVENNKSMIFVGGTASGKTSTLNAVSLFVPSESKVITIEDTRELTLYHKNWIPGVVREAFLGQEAQTIDMFELLRSALRQRPEYLIVGEVRGKEAYTLFQAMSTGHTTFSTMHAGDIQTAVNRLINEPINVPLMMLSALDVMVVQVLRYAGRKRVRRMETLSEFVGIDAATGNISTRELYKWNPVIDKIEQSGSSKVLDDIMRSKGLTREQLNKDLITEK